EQRPISINANGKIELNNKTEIGRVLAQDLDSGRNAKISYSILGPYANDAFYIDEQTGVIYARREFDREEEAEIQFSVQATDGGTPQLSSSCSVRVAIRDINDNAPTFEKQLYEVRVR